MINIKNYLLGIGFILICVLMTAIREVLFSKTLHQIDIFILIAISFGIAIAFFLPLQFSKSRLLFNKIKTNLKDIIYLNLTTAVMWIAFIFALKFIEPAVVSSINSALIPVATLIFSLSMLKENTIKKWDLLSSLGILLSIIFLTMIVLTDRSGSKNEEMILIFLGICGAILSGTITAVNTIITKRLLSAGMKATEMMAIRFFALIGISLAWIIWKSIPLSVDIYNLGIISIISFLGIVIPLFCFQIGLSKSDVHTAALLIALGPLVTFLVQIYFGGFQFSYFSLMGISLAMIFVLIGIIAKFLNLKRT